MSVCLHRHMDSVRIHGHVTYCTDEKQLLRLDWLVMASPAVRPVITMIGVIFYL